MYPVIRTAEAIVYLANQGVITFHIPPTLADDLDRPDWVIWDLDPPIPAWRRCEGGSHPA